jgi:hypothetical protein
MGAFFPVGAPMASSHPVFEAITLDNGMVTLKFWADSEKIYAIQSALTATSDVWQEVMEVPVVQLPSLIEMSLPIGSHPTEFYRLVANGNP